MSDIAFPQLTQVEEIFKDLVWDNLIDAALTALFAYAPWLAVPVVRPAITFILKKFSDRIFDAVKLQCDIAAIVIKNEACKRVYDKESLRLKIIAIEKGSESNEFKEARERAKLALSHFVSFGAVSR